jgi:hypothetical protein
MPYRSPLESLRRELAKLEEELSALRALPEPAPKPVVRSKKQRAKLERESRALQSELAKLEHRIRKRSEALGVRELTPRELARHLWARRISLGSTVLGVFILSVQVLLTVGSEQAEVRFLESSSLAWMIAAGVLVGFGLLAFWLSTLDRRKRQRGEIEADDFRSED